MFLHFLGTMSMFSPTICGFTIGTELLCTELLCTELLTVFFGSVLVTVLLADGTLLLASGLLMTVFKQVDGGPVLVATGGTLVVDAAVGTVLVAGDASVVVEGVGAVVVAVDGPAFLLGAFFLAGPFFLGAGGA
jgi:hypothetical protein